MESPLPLPDIYINPRHMIDANKPTHIVWWADRLNVSERELRSALDGVGPCALEVYWYLRGVAAKRAARYRRPLHPTTPRAGLHRQGDPCGLARRDAVAGGKTLASRRVKARRHATEPRGKKATADGRSRTAPVALVTDHPHRKQG